MSFDLACAVMVLERTPLVLDSLLGALPPGWTHVNEGADTWSPYDVVGHLIDGERTDWMPRVRRILDDSSDHAFEPFDRSAHLREQPRPSLASRLQDFRALRTENLEALAALRLSEADLGRTGQHPALGSVTLRQLLATWVAHDLDHVGQIARVMAKQLTDDTGPWVAYLRILQA